MSDKKSKRVAFTFDERNLTKLENMTEPGYFSSMPDALPFAPDNTAVRAHLRAAIHALNEHDCDSVRRHINEAVGLL